MALPTQKQLIQAARDIIEKRYIDGKHNMGAALSTKNGNVFVGVHVEAGCGRISLCAEAVAIGSAATYGDIDISQIVAVTESGDIVPPCGMCRELISDYAPDACVILEIKGKVQCVPVSELLPVKYEASKYPNRRKNSDD